MSQSIIRRPAVLDLDGDACDEFNLQPITVIDKGMCGEIILAKSKTDVKKKFIVKKYSLLNDEKVARNYMVFDTEVKFLQSLDHPYVAKCLQAAQCPDYLAISMPYYQRGSLDHCVGNIGLDISELCVIQVACALRYLHTNHLAHLDVKLDNIFLDDDFNAILGDFGLAVEMSPQELTLPKWKCGGTVGYYAPEWRKASLHDELNPYKMDCYCLGVVWWSLVLERDTGENIDYNLETRKRRDLDPRIRDLLLRLLQLNPTRRVTIEEFLNRIRRDSIHRHVIKEN